jgi:hypothetical protein
MGEERGVQARTTMIVMCLILIFFLMCITMIILLGFACLFPLAGRDFQHFSWIFGFTRTVQTLEDESVCSAALPAVDESTVSDEENDTTNDGNVDDDKHEENRLEAPRPLRAGSVTNTRCRSTASYV